LATGPTGPTGECECPFCHTDARGYALIGSEVYVIDTQTQQMLDTFSVPDDDLGFAIAANADADELYVLTRDGVKVLDAADGTPLDFIPVSSLSLAPPFLKLLYNPANGKLYLASDGDDLRVIDPQTHAVSSVASVPAGWAALDTGNNNVITVFGSDLYVVSGATGALLRTVPLTGSLLGSSNNVAVDPVSHYAYVLTSTGVPASDSVNVVDTIAGALVDAFQATNVTAITLDPNSHTIYALSDSQTILTLDAVTGTPMGSFESGNNGSIVSAAGDPADNRVYWFDFDLSGYNGYYTLRTLDAATGTADEVLPYTMVLANDGYADLAFIRKKICELPMGPTGPAAFNCSASPFAYMASHEGRSGPGVPGTVSVVDPASHEVVRTFPVDIAQTVAVDPIHGVLAVGKGEYGVVFLDLNTGAELSSDTGGDRIVGAVNPANGKFYVQTDNSIEVYSGNPPALLRTIPTIASTLLLDSCNNDLYALYDGTIIVINGNTDTVTNSFPIPADSDVVSIGLDPCRGRLYEYGATPGDNLFLASYDLTTQNQLESFSLGTGTPSGALGVNPATDLVYLSYAPESGETAIFNGTTLAQAGIIGVAIIGPVVDTRDNLIYGEVYGGNQIIVDGKSNTVIATPVPPYGQFFTGMALGTCGNCDCRCICPTSPACTISGNVYALQNEAIGVIDPKTHQEVSSIPLTASGGAFAQAFAFNPDNGQLYVSTDTEIYAYDSVTGDYIRPFASEPATDIVYNPAANKVYFIAPDGTLYIYGADSHSEIASILLSPGAVLAVDPSTNQVYAAVTANGVHVISGATNTQTALIPLVDADQLAVDPTRHRLYASDLGGTLHVINTQTNTETDAFSLPTGATYGLAVNPNTNLLYANYGNRIESFDPDTGSLLDEIGGTGISAFAVDPVSNLIYYYNAYGDVHIFSGIDNESLDFFAMDGGIAFAPGTRKVCPAQSAALLPVTLNLGTAAGPMALGQKVTLPVSQLAHLTLLYSSKGLEISITA